jgi:4-alpha-glucanotransferase
MSPSPIYFTLVLHFHQPVGNFHEVFARAHDLAYKPLLDHLLAYPDIPVGLHFSGCLLDWLLAHRPEIRVQVQRLVDRGQAEILTGGYYEPILPMLRPEDAQGQVRMHNRVVEDLWSVRPTGLWLTERV